MPGTTRPDGGRAQEAETYTAQIGSIERRADTIRRCFLLALVALAGTIASCLLLGLGLYIKDAALVAVIVFVLALICLLPRQSTTHVKSGSPSVQCRKKHSIYASWISNKPPSYPS